MALCYKDRTYCISACANNKCPRMLTNKIKKEANKIKLPISICDFKCKFFVEKRKEK